MIYLPFVYRANPDGSIDSICTTCFLTVATETAKDKLASRENCHTCEPCWWWNPRRPVLVRQVSRG